MRLQIYTLVILLSVIALSCSKSIDVSRTLDSTPTIFPDYIGVTIPPNIAPLNFKLVDSTSTESRLKIEGKGIEIEIDAKGGQFQIPQSKWKELLSSSIGDSIKLTVFSKKNTEWIAYTPFTMNVVKDSIDAYLAYRLIEPGYELWNEMGIYQRNLESFTQTAILENKMVGGDCMNCHSFRMQDPDQMMLHIRGANAATILMIDGKIEKLNTKTEQTMSPLVYPSWHPSGKYIAFSVNKTKQDFHTIDRNRVEVYDSASDVVVYDIEKHEIITTASLFADNRFESFPTFSPDGQTLYFSTAEACDMPADYKNVKYSICAIGFNPGTREFASSVDTIFNAQTEGKSASFPRVSPDGKYLLYTKGDYGGFFVWHKEADLYIYNIETKQHYPLTLANSNDSESYHSWSSNSRWIVYSSRRIDGLYTRPFIAYINDKGEAEKAFVLPQEDVDFYASFMKSYNVPEFVKGKVKTKGYDIANQAKTNKGVNVTFKKQ